MSTLEQLIDNLDQRGILVLQVLVGQRAMALLSEKHVKQVTKPNVLKPEGYDHIRGSNMPESKS